MLEGICDLCGRASLLLTCALCGAKVCSKCCRGRVCSRCGGGRLL